MTEPGSASPGLPRRRRRLSDEETAQRMLRAAIGQVNRTGLTVSLEHISFEEVIRDAGVARSAVYRRWPYKDLFFNDLLAELARGNSPVIADSNPAAIAVVNRAILDHLHWLPRPELRPALVAELLRRGALHEFETFHASTEWRTYFALHATFLGLPDGELRTEVQRALTASEQSLVAGVAGAYERISRLLGVRLRPELGVTFETVAGLANATIRGLVLMGPANPGIEARRVQANPFGAPVPAEWSEPALGVASVVMTFLEPDPAVDFDDDAISALRAALTVGDWTNARPREPGSN